ncbi:hypothetical protein CAPTEDRAFT_227011 [Capitella teleta]|uniref:UBZ4-type domain-containing protein n=1 Tax=Capitella teleta TaxID=283909 RepID=R7V762_CAPTE|nr:hypothetical protein CAPTEDRAFT_227011 [Capitella teleta]|eukprot:ELU14678.1 hypothetical protein CAPTEDRAFT_227011 [Capitella teleta]
MAESHKSVECPVCNEYFLKSAIDRHVNECLNVHEDDPDIVEPSPSKKRKISNDENQNFENILNEKPVKAQSSTFKVKPGIPIAEQLRPTCFSEYSGQEKVLGENQALRKLLEKQQIPSMILWGPPGCGKTTLARIIAGKCQKSQMMRFSQLSATTAGVADVKEVVKIAKKELRMLKRRTILFIDEIHRFNKLQQDALLPHIEDGTFVLIGATTENPSFRVNNAVLSRCKLIVLEALSAQNILEIIRRCLVKLDIRVVDSSDTDHQGRLSIEGEAVSLLSKCSEGDARRSLNTLQTAIEVSNQESKRLITVDDIRASLQRSHLRYDRAGDEHYDCASALQKSIRGSSDSGAIYWLARMFEGGEDPLFIARRLLVCASEDIGLADPNALGIAVATFQACQFLGFPECKFNLSHCATYLARAPKSAECTVAYQRAKQSILKHEGPLPGVPLHLRNAPTQMMKDLGYGKGYKYNYAYSEPVEQEYLPEGMENLDLFAK